MSVYPCVCLFNELCGSNATKAPSISTLTPSVECQILRLTDYLHVLELIGSDCTAFGMDWIGYFCNVSFRYVRVHV